MNPAKQPASADVIRRRADRLVDEFPDGPLEILAADLESEASATYEDEAFEIALAIAAELRRRWRKEMAQAFLNLLQLLVAARN